VYEVKKVLIATLALALVATMVGLGVHAYFSDTETSTGNYFQAGTLDLKVNGADGPVSAIIEIGNVKPGDSGSKEVALKNDGSLLGIADLHIKNLQDLENGNTEPEGDDGEPGELSKAITVKITYDGNPIKEDTLYNLNCCAMDLGALGAGETKTVTISWSVSSGAGNGIQSDKCTFDIEFSLKTS
jgi:predicted ribosomally synthesized peptide with SipW-like signal peptide